MKHHSPEQSKKRPANKFWIVCKKCVSGFYGILQSLSGTFSLITLIVIAFVTFHAPVIGGVALASFATVIPAILAYAEHKETLQAVMLNAQQTSQPAIINNISNTNAPTNNDLPTRGQS